MKTLLFLLISLITFQVKSQELIHLDSIDEVHELSKKNN